MSKGKKLSPPVLLLLYSLVALGGTLAYHYFFSPHGHIIQPLLHSYVFFSSLAKFIRYFPAVALSVLVLWHSLRVQGNNEGQRFSLRFMENMRQPLITALLSAILYAVLSVFLGPIAENRMELAEVKSAMYFNSYGRLQQAEKNRDYAMAISHMDVCLRVWPENNELLQQQEMLNSLLEEAKNKDRSSFTAAQNGMKTDPFDSKPLDLLAALQKSQDAYSRRDFFTSHYYASIAQHLASDQSPEYREALRLQSEAWNEIAQLEADLDNPRDEASRIKYDVQRKKMEGYTAFMGEDFQRAYYIFSDLIINNSNDADIQRYFNLSRNSLQSIAFFKDEPVSLLGEPHTNVLLSIPAGNGSRDVLRMERLRIFSDASYAENFELLRVDSFGVVSFSVAGERVKLLPLGQRGLGEYIERGLDTGKPDKKMKRKGAGVEQSISVLFVALDRQDPTDKTEANWRVGAPEDGIYSRILLSLGYDDFINLVRVRRGVESLGFAQLFDLQQNLGEHGYRPEVFLLNFLIRISEPFTFLGLAIFALVLGWRLRAHERPGFLVLPVIAVLPFVVELLVRAMRSIQILIIGLFALSLPPALAIGMVVVAETFFVALCIIVLAGQRS